MTAIKKVGKDRYKVYIDKTEYLLEIFELYEDVYYEVTKDKQPVTQEEHERVMQVYWEL